MGEPHPGLLGREPAPDEPTAPDDEDLDGPHCPACGGRYDERARGDLPNRFTHDDGCTLSEAERARADLDRHRLLFSGRPFRRFTSPAEQELLAALGHDLARDDLVTVSADEDGNRVREWQALLEHATYGRVRGPSPIDAFVRDLKPNPFPFF